MQIVLNMRKQLISSICFSRPITTIEQVGEESEAENEVCKQFGTSVNIVLFSDHLIVFPGGDGKGVEKEVHQDDGEANEEEQTFFDLRLFTFLREDRKNQAKQNGDGAEHTENGTQKLH